MALTIDSKMKELVENEQTKAVITKWFPTLLTDPQGRMAMGMKCKALCAFPQSGISKENADVIAKEIEDAQK